MTGIELPGGGVALEDGSKSAETASMPAVPPDTPSSAWAAAATASWLGVCSAGADVPDNPADLAAGTIVDTGARPTAAVEFAERVAVNPETADDGVAVVTQSSDTPPLSGMAPTGIGMNVARTTLLPGSLRSGCVLSTTFVVLVIAKDDWPESDGTVKIPKSTVSWISRLWTLGDGAAVDSGNPSDAITIERHDARCNFITELPDVRRNADQIYVAPQQFSKVK